MPADLRGVGSRAGLDAHAGDARARDSTRACGTEPRCAGVRAPCSGTARWWHEDRPDRLRLDRGDASGEPERARRGGRVRLRSRSGAAGLGRPARPGPRASRDWESLLERGRPDAVLVLTPPRLHREVTVAALERGAARLPREARRARPRRRAGDRRRRSSAPGVVCAIGYQWRAIDWVADVRDALRRARRSACWSCACSARPRAARGSPTRRPAAVRCWSARATASTSCRRSPGRPCASRRPAPTCRWPAPTARPDSEIDDVLALTLELERGAVATVQVVWQRSELPRTYELDVIGDGARVTGVLDPEFRATGHRRRRAGRPALGAAPSVRGVERFLRRRARGRSGRGRLHARRRPPPRSRPRWPASRR